MLVSTHPKQCSLTVASHCNRDARYRNKKNNHDIGTQIHAQDFQLVTPFKLTLDKLLVKSCAVFLASCFPLPCYCRKIKHI